MNQGEFLKNFHSNNLEIKELIDALIEEWSYGFCKQVNTPLGNDSIEIEPYKDLDSTKSVIKSYMHLLCGYTPVCVDSGEVNYWINSGEIYREVEVKGKGKDLAHKLWEAMEKTKQFYDNENYMINGTFMTVIADFDVLEYWYLYSSICSSFSELHIPNGCFITGVDDITINIQIALKPIKKNSLYTKEKVIEEREKGRDIPSFLIKK